MANEITPINLSKVAQSAANDFALAMRDDRQIWDTEEPITAEDVRRECFNAASENATSAVYRAVGKLITPLAMALDLEAHENGALADFDAVLANYTEDMQADFTGVEDIKDWEAKLDYVRGALVECVKAKTAIAPLTVQQLLDYANSDPRLHVEGLRKEISALDYKGAANVFADDDIGDIPAALKRDKPAKHPTDFVTKEIDWDAEEAPRVKKTIKQAKQIAGEPKLCALAKVAGFSVKDMAEILGVSNGYYSFMTRGERKWTGLKPDQISKLLVELESRVEAINAMREALADPELVKPSL